MADIDSPTSYSGSGKNLFAPNMRVLFLLFVLVISHKRSHENVFHEIYRDSPIFEMAIFIKANRIMYDNCLK